MNGVWFGNKHSYSDLGLVLNSRNIPLPEPKLYTVEVPGADGILDLSTALTGDIKYENREIEMEFTVMSSGSQFEATKSLIANHLHGKTMNVVFDADSDFYYHGRCKITECNTSKNPATITISLDADPYKYKENKTVVSITGDGEVALENLQQKVVPTIYAVGDTDITFGTQTFGLAAGENIIPALLLEQGENIVSVENKVLARPYVTEEDRGRSFTRYGLTWTTNEDGSVTVNGTCTGSSSYVLKRNLFCKAGHQIRISGCPEGGSTTTYRLRVYISETGTYYNDFGEGAVTTAKSFDRWFMYAIYIANGAVLDNVTFNPQIVVDTVFEYQEGEL